MKQLTHFITIGVNNLEAVRKFYGEKFGWKQLNESDEIVFFKLNGFIISLFPADELAKDAGVTNDQSGNFRGFTLSINFNSEQEVTEAFRELRSRGVKIIKDPQKAFWGGFSGYIEDIEHNLWELVYNPFLVLADDGSVVTHK